jgi:drug/metabolite transporter (DMT)-like permease
MKSEQNKGYLMILLAGILWGSIGFFSTIMTNSGMDTGSVAFFRVLASSVMLGLLLIFKGKGFGLFRISKRGVLSCLLVGLFSQAFFNICYMSTIKNGGMATAAVFLYTSPVFVAIMSKLFFHEPLTSNKIIAILINIAGCILAVTGGDFSDVKISGSVVIVGVLAGFTYALLPVLSRTGADKEDPFTAAFYGQLFGMILLFLMIRPYHGTGAVFSWQLVLAIVGIGIVPSAMAYSAYYSGLSRIKETSKVPIFASVETIVAALIGFFAFGQSIGPGKILGIALVLVSIVFMNRKQGVDNEGPAEQITEK